MAKSRFGPLIEFVDQMDKMREFAQASETTPEGNRNVRAKSRAFPVETRKGG
jgi:hypothetical protein